MSFLDKIRPKPKEKKLSGVSHLGEGEFRATQREASIKNIAKDYGENGQVFLPSEAYKIYYRPSRKMGGSVNGSPATAMEITLSDGSISTIIFNRKSGDLTVLPESLPSIIIGEREANAVTYWDYQGRELWFEIDDGISFTPRHVRDVFTGEYQVERSDRRDFGIEEMIKKAVETFEFFGYTLLIE